MSESAVACVEVGGQLLGLSLFVHPVVLGIELKLFGFAFIHTATLPVPTVTVVTECRGGGGGGEVVC